jgi:AcrR family transcriptional regulator
MAKSTFLNLPEEKRAQIEEVATDEFARFSYGKASLSRIVDRLGIAKGSIYQYFDNKLGLYTWLLERGAQKKMKYFGGQVTPEPGRFFDWLEQAFAGGLRFALDHPRLARMSLAALHANDPQLKPLARTWQRAGMEYSEKLFREAQLHGEVREDLDPKTLAVLLRSMQNSLLEVLCAVAEVDAPEDLFEGDAAKKLSDDDIQRVVHQLIEVFRQGAANPDGPKVVPDAPRTTAFDVEETLSRMFPRDEGETE